MAFRPLTILRSIHDAVWGTIRANKVVFAANILLFVGGVGLLVLWIDGWRNRYLPKNFGIVENGFIYRSGQVHGDLIEDVLKEHHIRAVIDVSGDTGRSHEAEQLAVVERMGLERTTVEGLDGHGLGPIESYATAFTALVEARRAGKPALVHCRAGSERTGALV
ncbi:MAG: tyrosine-protein phosphatase, partial [Planctomycetota bacterium]|nr:tyrosine-protein phosphatase [Planctomycetota bacterium]